MEAQVDPVVVQALRLRILDQVLVQIHHQVQAEVLRRLQVQDQAQAEALHHLILDQVQDQAQAEALHPQILDLHLLLHQLLQVNLLLLLNKNHKLIQYTLINGIYYIIKENRIYVKLE